MPLFNIYKIKNKMEEPAFVMPPLDTNINTKKFTIDINKSENLMDKIYLQDTSFKKYFPDCILYEIEKYIYTGEKLKFNIEDLINLNPAITKPYLAYLISRMIFLINLKTLEHVIPLLYLIEDYPLSIEYMPEMCPKRIQINNLNLIHLNGISIIIQHDIKARANIRIRGISINKYVARYISFLSYSKNALDFRIFYHSVSNIGLESSYSTLIRLYKTNKYFFKSLICRLVNLGLDNKLFVLMQIIAFNNYYDALYGTKGGILYEIDFTNYISYHGFENISGRWSRTIRTNFYKTYDFYDYLIENFGHIFEFPGELRTNWISLIARMSYT